MNDSLVNRHIKIIVLEDEPAHAEAIKRYLSTSEHDCSISVAGTLGEFNTIVSGTIPDLVIADINLPDGTAFTLLGGNMEEQKWPVLIMTSYGDEEIAVKAIKMGALDYIVKSPEAFRNIVHVVNRNLREWRNFQRSRETERKFRILFETMDQGVIYQDSDGRITAANPAATRITGYSVLEMKNMSFFEKGPWFELNENGGGSIIPAKSHPALVARQTGKPVKDKVMAFKNPASSSLAWLLVSSMPTPGNIRKEYRLFTTITDITEMMLADIELKKAKQKAEESDRLKSVFMANMSHEIRTPMNGILGFADLLKTPELSGESQKLYIEAINSSGKRMLDIINDLIDISKIEAGQTELRKEPVNIPDLLEELMLFFRPEADKKRIRMNLDINLPPVRIITVTDRTKLAQIIINLLKNALKFTKAGGMIELGCSLRDEKTLLFRVKDNGAGIRKDLQDKIFERFRQGDLAEEHDGTGLGLAISKAYVEMLGGTIGVESEQGKGSEFFFTTPYLGNTRNEKKVSPDETHGSAHRLNILVAEDDDMSYFLINETLKRNNINSVHASDGREAVRIFSERNDIDLVLMDIKLPVMNGIEATREIKKINHGIPVIAQSAYVSQEEIQKSIDAGCDDYISKPVDIKLLMSKIMKFSSAGVASTALSTRNSSH